MTYDFVTADRKTLQAGTAVWLEGKSFMGLLTSPLGTLRGRIDQHKLCGPFLVEHVYHMAHDSCRVGIINPATGQERIVMVSWVIVAKPAKGSTND